MEVRYTEVPLYMKSKSPLIFSKEFSMREFDKRSKRFPFVYHFISSHKLHSLDYAVIFVGEN